MWWLGSSALGVLYVVAASVFGLPKPWLFSLAGVPVWGWWLGVGVADFIRMAASVYSAEKAALDRVDRVGSLTSRVEDFRREHAERLWKLEERLESARVEVERLYGLYREDPPGGHRPPEKRSEG